MQEFENPVKRDSTIPRDSTINPRDSTLAKGNVYKSVSSIILKIKELTAKAEQYEKDIKTANDNLVKNSCWVPVKRHHPFHCMRSFDIKGNMLRTNFTFSKPKYQRLTCKINYTEGCIWDTLILEPESGTLILGVCKRTSNALVLNYEKSVNDTETIFTTAPALVELRKQILNEKMLLRESSSEAFLSEAKKCDDQRVASRLRERSERYSQSREWKACYSICGCLKKVCRPIIKLAMNVSGGGPDIFSDTIEMALDTGLSMMESEDNKTADLVYREMLAIEMSLNK